jgi:hypothetical protein
MAAMTNIPEFLPNLALTGNCLLMGGVSRRGGESLRCRYDIAARLRYQNQTRAAERQCWRNEDESSSGERSSWIDLFLSHGIRRGEY